MWLCTSSRNENRIAARLDSETFFQVSEAVLAAATTASTSAGLARSTCPVTWPVAGS